MSSLRIIGKRGSKSRITITKTTGIQRYTNKSTNVSALINYGLAGGRLQTFLRKHPSANLLPIMNRNTARSKYEVVLDAEREGILVPESKLSLPRGANLSGWIEKRHHFYWLVLVSLEQNVDIELKVSIINGSLVIEDMS